MSSESLDLSVLARSKLHLSVGGKDSLHRWVLLKNSILRSSSSQPTSPAVPHKTDANPPDEGDNEDEEVCCEEEADSFMFPDASKLNGCGGADVNASEAEWLDSLLETLGEEDEHFNADHVAILPADDDDDQPFSPLISPMSSSDDLINPQPAYYPTPITVPYPVPYPPFHPPVIRSFELDSLNAPLDSRQTSYEDPLPYYYDDMDDVEDLAVPDAIEDTSDDESDVVSTPSLIRSSSNLSLVDPASIPLPVERRRPQLHIYIDTDDSFYHPFELDPLPFREDHFPSYNHHVYQEC